MLIDASKNKILKALVREVFGVSFVFLLIFLLVEFAKAGIISNYLNLNGFLIAVLILFVIDLSASDY
jgi:hypothetical protein